MERSSPDPKRNSKFVTASNVEREIPSTLTIQQAMCWMYTFAPNK